MKAFKVKRGKETYSRVELPQNLCPYGKRHSVMGKSRNEAVAKANEEMARWERGLDRDAGKNTLAEFLKEFLAYYKRDGGVAPSTYQDYRYHIESHIVPVLGKVTLKDLDPRKVDQFTRALNEKGLAARTSQYSFSVLRRALQFAVDWKYIPSNPASSRMRAAKRRQVHELSKIASSSGSGDESGELIPTALVSACSSAAACSASAEHPGEPEIDDRPWG